MSAYDRIMSGSKSSTKPPTQSGGAYARLMKDAGLPTKTTSTQGRVSQAASTFAQGMSPVTNFTKNIKVDIEAGAKDIEKGFQVGGTKGVQLIFKGAAKSGLRTAGDAAMAIFAPISSAIGVILGQVGGQKLIDETGKVIADSSGITDSKAFQDFAMSHPNAGTDFERLLTLSMAGFEKGKIEPARMVEESTKFAQKILGTTPPPPKKITPVATTGETKIPVTTPETRYKAYLVKQGYEPYTPTERLPTIEMGARAKDTIPTIQIGEPTSKPKSQFTYEPIKPTETISVPSAYERIMGEKTKSTTPTDISQTSLKVQQQAREAGIDIATSELSPIDRMSLSVEQTKAKDLISRDFETAKKIATEEISATPEKVGSVFNELKAKAIREGDAQLSLTLAKSKVGTEAAQLLKSFDDGIRLDADPIQAVRDLRRVKVERANKQLSKGETVEKVIKTEKAKATKVEKIDASAWATFIDNLTC